MRKLTRSPLTGILLLYCILTLPHLNKGLSALDAHGTIAAIERILDGQGYYPSRPPGHPATEVFLYLPVAYLLEINGIDFNWLVYNILQWLGGLSCLIAFYCLLRKVNPSIKLICIGMLSFICCHLFIINSIDGAEFNWGLSCLFLALLYIIKSFRSKPSKTKSYVIFSAIFVAFSTGFRQEFVFFFVIYPILFHIHPQLQFKEIIKCGLITFLVGMIIWLPVFIYNSFTIPMPMPMPETGLRELRNRILGGGYKLIFLGLTLPVTIVIIGWIFRIFETHRKFLQSDKEIIFLYASVSVVSVLFTSLYFVYPYKPDFILLIIPLLILLGVSINWKNELYWLAAGTMASLAFHIDIFKDRVLVFPHTETSLYWKGILEKPHHKADRLQKEIGLVKGKSKKVLLITELWSSDYAYLIDSQQVGLRKHTQPPFPPSNFNIYLMPDNNSSILLASRRAIEELETLSKYADDDYEICINKRFLRSFFFKYNIRFPIGDRIQIGKGLWCTVI